MKALLCLATLLASGIGVAHPGHADVPRVTFKSPASASDLPNFYRSIQALSADSLINGTAVALV